MRPTGCASCTRPAPTATSVYPIVDDTPTLVWLANLAALELHTHQWRVAPDSDETTIDDALPVDQLVIDLDPGPGVEMPLIATAALLIAGELGAAGLTSVAKTSGGKGHPALRAAGADARPAASSTGCAPRRAAGRPASPRRCS